MKVQSNPEGILVKAELVETEFGNIPEYVDDVGGVIPMKVRGAKKAKVHILNDATPAKLPDGTIFQGYALCGAGYPSMQFPYGSGTIVQARDIIPSGARRGAIKITCYRCIKLNALNVGPTFARSFTATSFGSNRTPHEMLPGGREGFYAMELDQTLDMSPSQLQAAVENAAVDREYWENQQDLWKVGAPWARTQPDSIAEAEKMGIVDEDMGTYPETVLAPKSIPRTNNPAFKVGDRVSEKGRLGKITALHTKGTADVLFDDMDFAIRRQMPSLMKVKANGIESEIQSMIAKAPPSWKAMFKEKVGKTNPTIDEAIHAILKLTPSGNEYGPTGAKRWSVPASVKADAIKGLRLSFREKYTSASGIGLARAMQLATWPKIWDRSVNRMFAYFDRHISDTESSTFGNDANPSNGWMAWLNWGGTPGYEWAASILGKQRKIMAREHGYDRNDRSKRVKSIRKALPMAANPRDKKHGVLVETYDPRLAQRNAVVQGIYETLVRQHLGATHNKAFKDKAGVRLDVSSMLSKATIDKLVASAFQLATGVGQKHGYLKKGTQEATRKAIALSKERAKDKAHLWENTLDYETTLSMRRKDADKYRILVWKEKGKKTKYYVMPEGTFSYTMDAAVDKLHDLQRKSGTYRIPPKKRNPSIHSAMETYGSGADPYTTKVVMASPRPVMVTWEDGTEVQIGTYMGLTIQGPESAFRIRRDGVETRNLLDGITEEVGSFSSFAMKDVVYTESFASEPEGAHINSLWQSPDRTKRGALSRGEDPLYVEILKFWRTNNLKGQYKDSPDETWVSILDLIEGWGSIADAYESTTGLARPGASEVWDAIAELKDRGVIKLRGVRKDINNQVDNLTLQITYDNDLYPFAQLIAQGIASYDEDEGMLYIKDRIVEYTLPNQFKTTESRQTAEGDTIVEVQEKQYRKRIAGTLYTPTSFISTYGHVVYNEVVIGVIKARAKEARVPARTYLSELVLGQRAKLPPSDFIVFTVDEWTKTRTFLEKAAFRGDFFNVPALSGGPYFNSLINAAAKQLEYQAQLLGKQIKKKIPFSLVPRPVVVKAAEKGVVPPMSIRPAFEVPDTVNYEGPSELLSLVTQSFLDSLVSVLADKLAISTTVMSIPTRAPKAGEKVEDILMSTKENLFPLAPKYDESRAVMEENAVLLLTEIEKDPEIDIGVPMFVVQIYEEGQEPIVPQQVLMNRARANKNAAYNVKIPTSTTLRGQAVKDAADQIAKKIQGRKPTVVAFIGPKEIENAENVAAFLRELFLTHLPAALK